MLSLFGNITLYLALFFALLQVILPLCGYWRHNPYFFACARPTAYGQFLFVLIAYVLLTSAFVTNDFSIAYVAANSHASLPLLYRLTAVWGAHEGSILFWILILNGWTIAFVWTIQRQRLFLFPLVVAILALVSLCFLCFLLFTSNPFLLTTSPQAGRDLNPLLQDPGFVIHPPMLYIGYVGSVVAFAITQAALLTGQLNAVWARITRQFTVAAWCFLTMGILLGSWWAYRVLGWGGFWFWDPVENASLLPWLASTALIHVLLLTEKRHTAQSWAVLLTIITFALSLLGTFLVRSGVLISVHTFAHDPARGIFLLLLLAMLIGIALLIYALRISPANKNITVVTDNNTDNKWWPREISLLLNSALLFIAMLTILLGTLYPLIMDALGLGTISVGAPYFNLVMAPLIFILMFFMGFAPAARWDNQSLSQLWQLVWKQLVIGFVAATVLLWCIVGLIEINALISLGLSFWIIISVFGSFKIAPGMALAHSGFAILIIGILLSSLLSQEREVRIKPGESTLIGPYQFLFFDTKSIQEKNYRGIRADFEVIKGQRHVTHLYPEKRIYPVREMVMSHVDIHPSIFRDLYIALGEPLNQDYWSVRIYYKPFVRWIWFGGIIMILGGILSLRQQTTRSKQPCMQK
ncbi:MAG TPA: heme lyase CcmF/NrfE family subunit [Gammaproteobacteria bacterium]|jgi:cytochrome c-type biogenesis protein CcmF|nr:heme lyase CcmF/NrfE family subunit [Gammaproteobacteria bacterium]